MGRGWIAAGADLHGFEAEGGDAVEHFVEREIGVDGIKHADGNFAARARGQRATGITRGGSHESGSGLGQSRGGRQQSTCGGKKFSAAAGVWGEIFLHGSDPSLESVPTKIG